MTKPLSIENAIGQLSKEVQHIWEHVLTSGEDKTKILIALALANISVEVSNIQSDLENISQWCDNNWGPLVEDETKEPDKS
jgi:hypothetical protein